jgi:hypothetical protein
MLLGRNATQPSTVFVCGSVPLPPLSRTYYASGRSQTTATAVGTIKRYSKALEYKYRVKTVALDTLKRYSILSLSLYLE